MAISTTEIQVKWSTANTLAIATGNVGTSDAITHAATAFQALYMVKADTTTTTAVAGDTLDCYLLRTTGDPDADADSADEYPTTTQGEFLFTLDCNADDPAIKTAHVPGPFQTTKLYIVNNAAVQVTVSSQVLEQTG